MTCGSGFSTMVGAEARTQNAGCGGESDARGRCKKSRSLQNQTKLGLLVFICV